MRYYIADLHFYHESLNDRMDCRGFKSLEEMHKYMIYQWNAKVNPRDEVVILGDFSIAKGKLTNEIAEKLHGRLYLIEGNHDKFLEDRQFDKSRFEWIKPYAEVKDKKRKVILSHYPIMCYNGQYRWDEKGMPKTYMLYGHVHDTFDQRIVERHRKLMEETYREIHIKGSGFTQKNQDNEKGQLISRPIPCEMINCFCMYSDYQPLSLDEWIENDKKRQLLLDDKNM